MININYLFEKNAVKKQNDKMLVLLKLKGEKDVVQKQDKRKLNLSLAIDVSTSMDRPLSNKTIQKVRRVPVHYPKYTPNPTYPDLEKMPYIMPSILREEVFPKNIEYREEFYYERVSNESRLDKAKKAAIKAVEELKEGDILSIVTFSNVVSKILNNTVINKTNKKEIINKLNLIRASGNTDLHEGWLQSATEVAQNISEKYINRVIVITDGETNHGIINPKKIEENVLKLYKKGISTSCIGLGDSFNESLLEAMSNSGGGNFYYVEKDEELQKVFDDEFSGLNNLVASEVKLSFKEDFAKLSKILNNFKQDENQYLIGNILNGKQLDILMELNLNIPKGKKSIDLGTVVISYKTEEGSQTEEVTLSIPVASEKVWNNMEFNKEVKIQETLMIVSNDKFEIAKAIDEGRKDYAKELMNSSMNLVAAASASGYNDARLSVETNYLKDTLASCDNTSNQTLSKSIRYQSYQTRNNKI